MYKQGENKSKNPNLIVHFHWMYSNPNTKVSKNIRIYFVSVLQKKVIMLVPLQLTVNPYSDSPVISLKINIPQPWTYSHLLGFKHSFGCK